MSSFIPDAIQPKSFSCFSLITCRPPPVRIGIAGQCRQIYHTWAFSTTFKKTRSEPAKRAVVVEKKLGPEVPSCEPRDVRFSTGVQSNFLTWILLPNLFDYERSSLHWEGKPVGFYNISGENWLYIWSYVTYLDWLIIKDPKHMNGKTKIHRLIEMWGNSSLALSLLCFRTIDLDQPIKEASYKCGGGVQAKGEG